MPVTPFIGTVTPWAPNFAPRSWAFCDGQLLLINQNQALFSILGTTYGGDGRTTFGLPDLRGRVAVHPGTGPGLPTVSLGEKTGQENVALSTPTLAPHNHPATGDVAVMATTDDGTTVNPSATDRLAAAKLQMVGIDVNRYSGAAADTSLGGLSATASVDSKGGGSTHTNVQPSLGINYIIALQGVFPSRN